jgi:hypothetical protein
LESLALSLIVPPNGSGGGGSCFPSSVMVALGEPDSPLICCAEAGAVTSAKPQTRTKTRPQTADLIDRIGPRDFGRTSGITASNKCGLDVAFFEDQHSEL